MKNFISISTILDRVMQHPLMHEMPFDVGVRHSIDCIRLVGMPILFDRKYKEIAIEEYRGSLPEDFMEMDMESAVRLVTGTDTSKTYTPMVLSASLYTGFSDKIEPTKNQDDWDYNTNQLKYTIKGGYIYTPIEECVVDVVYKGMYLDDDNLPSIPDSTQLTLAIENYIKAKYFRILSDLGKISPAAAQAAEQEYSWYVGAAQTANTLTTLDERQAISNMLTNLFISNRDHTTFYENVGMPEKLRRNI